MIGGYKSYTEYKSYSEIKKLDFIVNTINEHRGKSQAHNVNILEIGCGKGNICLPLASLGYRILGIDLDPNEIAYAIKRNQFPNASFKIMDAEKIEIEDKWDIVICSEVFEHLSLPEKLLMKLSKIVKPDGVVIVTVPNGYGPYELLFETPLRLINKLKRTSDPYGHKQNYSFKKFSGFLDQFFSISTIKHSDFISFWPIIREVDLLVKIDCNIADLLPHYLTSGWYFECRPK